MIKFKSIQISFSLNYDDRYIAFLILSSIKSNFIKRESWVGGDLNHIKNFICISLKQQINR